MSSSSVVYRLSNKGLDNDGFLLDKTHAEDSSQPLFQHVLQSDNTVSTENVATLQYCFKPLWIAMRILGMLPIYRNQTGTMEFKIASKAFNYSVMFFVLVGIYTASVTQHRVSYLLKTSGSFNALIFSYMCVVYCCAYWFLPVGHWFGATKMSVYVNNWMQFQVHTRKLTGSPVSFSMYRPILFWAISIPVLSTCLLVCEFFMLQAFEYWEALYYVFINIMIHYHSVAWCYICSALSSAASHLKLTLAAELQAHPHDLTVVPKYRELWEELNYLTKETGNVLCYAYGSLKLISFTILTCSIYGALCDGGLNHVTSKQIGLGLNSVIVLAAIFLVCNSAHLATETVGNGFLNHLKQQKPQLEAIQRQLDEFQKAVCVDPPSMSLGGYVVINRQLLISLLATIVTYLIVLLQFKAGEGKEPVDSPIADDA